MTRILTFTGDKAATRFQLLRTAVLNAGDGKGERTRAIIRQEARLLDALDSVSDNALNRWALEGNHVPPADADKDARVLKTSLPDAVNNPGPVALTLTQEDFDLLSTYVDKTPWTPRASRDAVDCQDWLSAAEKVE